MKILIIAYHFPPDPAVGGLRAAKVARKFLDAGDEVHVIAAPAPSPGAAEELRHPRLYIHRITPWSSPRDLYRKIKARLHGSRRPSLADEVPQPIAAPTNMPSWKRYLLSLFLLPDDRQGWIPPVVRKSLRLVRSGVDVMYTTAPPFSTHLAGLLVKRLTGVRWGLEFRDPWVGNPGKPDHFRSRWSDALERWLEARCLTAADRLIFVTEAARDLYSSRSTPTLSGRMHVVRSGIDRIREVPAPRPSDSPFQITYLGNLYHRRDPRPFLSAVAAVRDRGGLPSPTVIRFVGQCRWYYDISVERLAEELGLGEVVQFMDWVPHDQCEAILEESDLLLLLAQDQPAQVPNKLYEYLGTGVPILAFADGGGETAWMLRKLRRHYVVDSDKPELVEETVAAALKGEANLRVDAAGILSDWSTERQMQRLHDIMAV